MDEYDVSVPDGEPGELVLRADEPFSFATDYLGMPEQTVEAWRNLWIHIGDRAVREAGGAFRFLDRIKDAIRRLGENISSYEVEATLLSHPAIVRKVLALPDVQKRLQKLGHDAAPSTPEELAAMIEADSAK